MKGNRGGGSLPAATAVKMLTGSTRLPKPGTEPMPEKEPTLPQPPIHLSLEEKVIWRRHVDLMPKELLTGFDARLFEEFVSAAATLDEVKVQIKAEGWVVTVPASEKTITKPDGTTITTTTPERKVVSP